MQSTVNWALLGLVIERESYAYELAQRFERTYAGALQLSSTSHVYAALGALQSRSLVEETAGTRSGRQPRPHYRATESGVKEYLRWLVRQFRDDHRRAHLLVIQLAGLTRDPDVALEIVEGFERVCLQRTAETPIAADDGAPADAAGGLLARLLGEHDRLVVGASLAWVQYVRRELEESRRARPRSWTSCRSPT